jgi:hypothetical protein
MIKSHLVSRAPMSLRQRRSSQLRLLRLLMRNNYVGLVLGNRHTLFCLYEVDSALLMVSQPEYVHPIDAI